MRTIDPGRGPAPEWSKECRCTGAGNGNNGCQALLLVEWSDLYLTCLEGDVRDFLRHRPSRSPSSPQEHLGWVNEAFAHGSGPMDFGDTAVFITFRCHNCEKETDILTLSAHEISQRGFYMLPTKREWDQARMRFAKE